MREAELPDGTVLEFPDETPDSVMDMAVKKHLSPVVQKPQLSKREQTAQRIATSDDRGDVEKSLEIGAQLGIGPAVDLATRALTPAPWKAGAIGFALGPILSTAPLKKAEEDISTTAKVIGETYNNIPQRARDIIEAVALPASIYPASLAGKAVSAGSKGSIATRRLNTITNDVMPSLTAKSAAVEAAGHSKDIPVLGGLYKKTVETPSPVELESVGEVAKIKGYNIKGSNLDKHNAVHGAIQEEAIKLGNALKKEKFNLMEEVPERVLTSPDPMGGAPIIGETIPATVRNKFDSVLETVHGDISRNATLTGDAKNVASDVVAKAKELMGKNPPTLSGLLQVRQDIDKWAKMSDKKFFDKTGARQYAIREIRNAINDFIDVNAKSVAVKESLKRQSALYRAKDVLQEKAGLDIKSRAVEAQSPSTLMNKAKNIGKAAIKGTIK